MDWDNVTWEEVLVAMKEVEWSSPPRPVLEFFSKFGGRTSPLKWSSRLKCNLYMYRTNYFILVILHLLIATAFVRSPMAMVAVMMATIATAGWNDSFATFLSERITRATRQVYPPLAAKMRPPHISTGRGGPSKGAIHICGKNRWMVSIGLTSVSVLVWFLSSTMKVILGAFIISIMFTLIHASFRTPNLKARLNTFREEFRAVWRSYADP